MIACERCGEPLDPREAERRINLVEHLVPVNSMDDMLSIEVKIGDDDV